MKKILFSIYTGGCPGDLAGGPNNIIYKLIYSSKKHDYEFDYFSYDLFVEKLNRDKLLNIDNSRTIKKKAASHLYQNLGFYKRIFSSDYYLPIHLRKKDKKYNSFRDKIKKYDIIHCHDSIALSMVSNEVDNAKKIITVHSKGPLSDELQNMVYDNELSRRVNSKLKLLERKSIQQADIITFPSKSALYYFEESMGMNFDNRKVKIIYNGIDIEYINSIKYDDDILLKYSIDKKKDTLLILNVAAHVKEKRIDLLLQVINEIKFKLKKEVLLVNIGIGDLTEELIRQTKKLKIENDVKFLYKVANKDVIQLLKASDLFLMTSEKVVFDLVVLEALACEACCVVSNNGGNKEIIKDGENGYLVDTGNVEHIAKKIVMLDRNKTKVRAQETARQFSINRMVNEYFELYQNLLNEV